MIPDAERGEAVVACTCPACAHRAAAVAVAVTEDGWPSAAEPTEPTVGIAAARDRAVAGVPGPGERVGRYVVLHAIGCGGMGVVLAAHDPELDRLVALKLVQPSTPPALATRAHELLRREAQAMARLHHGNVVAVYDVGCHDGGTFLAMQLVPGVSLDRWLRTGRRGWRSILAMCDGAGRGLAATHRAGLVHRDVKPTNILVGDDGIARIADFGIAVTGGASGERHGGTPAYMAPEQRLGAADARSDQFSFCASTFEALWGVRPFGGRSPDDLAREIAAGRLREIRRGAVPSHVLVALARGLAADPGDRFPSMEALLAALDVSAPVIPFERSPHRAAERT
jgi:serine/threonine protein kinase